MSFLNHDHKYEIHRFHAFEAAAAVLQVAREKTNAELHLERIPTSDNTASNPNYIGEWTIFLYDLQGRTRDWYESLIQESIQIALAIELRKHDQFNSLANIWHLRAENYRVARYDVVKK